MDQANIIDSKFRFAIIVAKRAKQLINGAKQLVEIEAQNPLTIAIEEVNQGLITTELLDSVNLYLQEASQAVEEESETAGEEDGEVEVDLPEENAETGLELVDEAPDTPEKEEKEEETAEEET